MSSPEMRSAIRPRPPSHARALLLALGLASLAPAGAAQAFDASVLKIEVNQSIQAGTTKLVAGRATFVRAVVRVVDPPSNPVPVDGLLRVYADGVELPGSPYFSDNGPYPAKPGIDVSTEDGTLNFIFVAPLSGDVVVSVEVNPPGPSYVPEGITSNNITVSSSLAFTFQRAPELAYAPIDYRPGGSSVPNLPDPALIEPGMGDNFLHGIYRTPDWYYHRTDAPSKLWTASLSGTGSELLSALQVDKALMVPEPDFLYGWVPGGLPYNGQSIIDGDVAMGNTEPVRYQRTIAHELGHNFGLQHNTLATGLVGIDVEEHLHLTQGLGLIKPATLKDIMYAGLFTSEAWVASPSYGVFFDHEVFDPLGGSQPEQPGSRLLVAGLWNTASGALTAHDVLLLPQAKPTAPVEPRSADLVVRAWVRSTLVAELPLAALSSADECAGADSAEATSPLVGWSAVLAIPAGVAIDRLTVVQAGPRPAATLELLASASAPQVAFTQPAGSGLSGSQVHVAWSAADADGDALRFHLRYSPDGGLRSVPLATGLRTTEADVDLSQLPALVSGQGWFELLASDGLHTTIVRTPALSAPESVTAGSAPWVQVVSPDDGTSILRGATLVLHSSGWDLEDRGLDGSSLVWTSDMDGPLGTGRLLPVTELSAGSHVITVTATDSDGQLAADSATILVINRGLPDVGLTCQTSLGFGGPGASQLSLCGGELASGSTADLTLAGAPPLAPVLLLAGTASSPKPFKGGQLVPMPAQLLAVLVADAAGSAGLAELPGGGGPLTVYVQALVADAGQPHGLGLSNALKVELLP